MYARDLSESEQRNVSLRLRTLVPPLLRNLRVSKSSIYAHEEDEDVVWAHAMLADDTFRDLMAANGRCNEEEKYA